MGAEDWMLLYAHGEVAPVLRSAGERAPECVGEDKPSTPEGN